MLNLSPQTLPWKNPRWLISNAVIVTSAFGFILGLVAIAGLVLHSPMPFFQNLAFLSLLLLLASLGLKRALQRFEDEVKPIDPLTGLLSRQSFVTHLHQLLKASTQRHTLLYMDLDGFQNIKSVCGVSGADLLLQQVANILSGRIRTTDTLARIGRDSFAVLLLGCPLDQGIRIANSMREAVRNFHFRWDVHCFNTSVSMGLLQLDMHQRDILAAMDAAYKACQEAKSKGRDRVQIYRSGSIERDEETLRSRLIAQVNQALDVDRFCLFQQKIVPIPREGSITNHKVHYEILLRMMDDRGQLIMPNMILPIAEKYHLLTAIDRWVISHAFAHFAKLNTKDFKDICYTINLTGATLGDGSFLAFIKNEIRKHKIPPQSICFEITETNAVANLMKAAGLMHELKALGFSFSLDDFGTGMSSFEYLKYLPVDYLKIDGTFVKDIAHDKVDFAIVEAMSRIGHTLGKTIIAEYVESQPILNALKTLQIDYAQGYYIGEPEPLVESPLFFADPDLQLVA